MNSMETKWGGRLQCGAGEGGSGAQEFVFALRRSEGSQKKQETVTTIILFVCSMSSYAHPFQQNMKVRLKAFVGEASDSFSETGTVLWPAAPLLCYFLLSDAGRRLLNGTSVLELGAGVGIPGLIAGQTCHTLVLSDHNLEVVERLKANVKLNRDSLLVNCQTVSVEAIDWSDYLQPHAVGTRGAPTQPTHRFQIILGADVVYSTETVEMLVSAVDALLLDSPDAVFLLAYVSRWPAVDAALVIYIYI